MLHPTPGFLVRASLIGACAAPLVVSAPDPRAAEPDPLAAQVASAVDVEALSRLEREACDLEPLRGGDLHFDTEETVLLILGIVLIVVLVA
jgi:hypothetical protein